jgi:hypothetical protein
MKKTLSIVAVALMMAGSVAYACSGCGCEAKKAEKKEKSDCSSCTGQKKQTACSGSQKAEKAQHDSDHTEKAA